MVEKDPGKASSSTSRSLSPKKKQQQRGQGGPPQTGRPQLSQPQQEGLQQQVEREGREAKNVLSWRVPVPQTSRPSSAGSSMRCEVGSVASSNSNGTSRRRDKVRTRTLSSSGASVASTVSSNGSIRGGRCLSEGDVSPLPTAATLRGLQRPPQQQRGESPSSGREDNCGGGRHRIRKTFWKYLFRCVHQSVDELYVLCEAETSIEHCEEAAKLLESCGRDFVKLIERIQVQRQFEEESHRKGGSGETPKGVGWEVRKTTVGGSLAGQQSAIIMDAIERMAGQAEEAGGGGGEGQARTPSASPTPSLSHRAHGRVARQANQACELTPPIESKEEAADEEAAGGGGGGGGEEAAADNNAQQVAAPQHLDFGTAGESEVDEEEEEEEDMDEEATDNEVAMATEEVWAEAEAWIEAEQRAEEDAWRRLEQHNNEELEAAAVAAATAERARGASGGKARSQADCLVDVDEEELEALLEGGGEDDEEEEEDSELDHRSSSRECFFSDEDHHLGLATPSTSFSSPPNSPPRYGVTGGGASTLSSVSGGSGGHATAASQGGAGAEGGGMGGGSGSDYALSRRQLRAKLSSPERKRPTPQEAKRRLHEKHFLADLKRAYLETERQNRLRQAAERMKDVNERRVKKLALAGKVYQAKLGQAERRAQAHIQAIARKAENETSKVKEVEFIKTLTGAFYRVSLDPRLPHAFIHLPTPTTPPQQPKPCKPP